MPYEPARLPAKRAAGQDRAAPVGVHSAADPGDVADEGAALDDDGIPAHMEPAAETIAPGRRPGIAVGKRQPLQPRRLARLVAEGDPSQPLAVDHHAIGSAGLAAQRDAGLEGQVVLAVDAARRLDHVAGESRVQRGLDGGGVDGDAPGAGLGQDRQQKKAERQARRRRSSHDGPPSPTGSDAVARAGTRMPQRESRRILPEATPRVPMAVRQGASRRAILMGEHTAVPHTHDASPRGCVLLRSRPGLEQLR